MIDYQKKIIFLRRYLIGGSLILLNWFCHSCIHSGYFKFPLLKNLNGRDAEFSFAIAIQNLAWGIGTPLFSAFAEKYGDRKAIFVGNNIICNRFIN